MDAACLIDELLLQKSLALTVINVTKLNFPCYSEVIKRFIFTLNCILHMVLKKNLSALSLSLSLSLSIYLSLSLSSHRFLHTFPGSSVSR